MDFDNAISDIELFWTSRPSVTSKNRATWNEQKINVMGYLTDLRENPDHDLQDDELARVKGLLNKISGKGWRTKNKKKHAAELADLYNQRLAELDGLIQKLRTEKSKEPVQVPEEQDAAEESPATTVDEVQGGGGEASRDGEADSVGGEAAEGTRDGDERDDDFDNLDGGPEDAEV